MTSDPLAWQNKRLEKGRQMRRKSESSLEYIFTRELLKFSLIWLAALLASYYSLVKNR